VLRIPSVLLPGPVQLPVPRMQLPVMDATGPVAARANGHAVTLAPLPVHGDVSGWPQATAPNEPERARMPPNKRERRRADGTAFIVVALFAVAQVAVVAFSGSWQHQYELSIHLGQAHWVAGMQPLSVEGLIASATLVIWYAARFKCGIPLGAYLVLAAGVGQTVLMNLGADYRWPWLGPEISVWPAVAFVAAYEMAVWLVRKRQDVASRAEHDDTGVQPAAVPAVPPREDKQPDRQVDRQVDKPAPRRAIPARTALDKAADIIRRHPDWTDAAVAKSAGVSTKTVQRARNGTAKTPLT
jgi:nitrate reductase NapE component